VFHCSLIHEGTKSGKGFGPCNSLLAKKIMLKLLKLPIRVYEFKTITGLNLYETDG
jgi:hypothetical protein